MSTPNPDGRIRRALRARAEQVTETDLRPAQPPNSWSLPTRRPWRWGGPLLVAAAVVAFAVGTGVIVDTFRSAKARPAATAARGPSGQTVAGSSVATPPTSTGPAAPSPLPSKASTTGSNPVQPFTLGYEPLWPFASYTQAEQWRSSGGGSEPWHLDAGQTALSFTRGYLGFTEIDQLTSFTMDAQGGHVGVGFRAPNGQSRTAAVLHLVRFGSATNAPWEVVGSDDTTFSIENPPYGSAVSRPVTIGGHITGSDESIHAWVRARASERATGEKCCLPAGGQNSLWSMQLSFSGSGTLTLVASTGGHLQQVERFAIQGVHAD